MLSRIVSVGDRIEIKRIRTSLKNSSDTPSSIKTYISQVYDIESESSLTVAMPIVESRLIPLETKVKYEVLFLTSNGLYQCIGTITDRYKEEGVYVMVLELVTDLSKVQRRQYYRLECNINFRYRVLLEEEYEFFMQNPDYTSVEGLFTDGIALDLSGGGMRFISPEKLIENDKLLVLLELEVGNKKNEFNIIADVRYAEVTQNNMGVFESRIEFLNLKTKTRELLIKYIFEQERLKRKRIKD